MQIYSIPLIKKQRFSFLSTNKIQVHSDANSWDLSLFTFTKSLRISLEDCYRHKVNHIQQEAHNSVFKYLLSSTSCL